MKRECSDKTALPKLAFLFVLNIFFLFLFYKNPSRGGAKMAEE